MRILLDECLPRRFARELPGHEVWTVPQAGWAGLTNGALLARIEGAFDAFVTIDANLAAQQNLSVLSLRIVVLRARSNALKALTPLAPKLLATLEAAEPGSVVIVEAD